MANASYVQDSFTGGEKSQLAQGRITDREYRTWMNVCLNGHPTEAGGWIRRSGTMYAGHTRNGANGRVYKFDFSASSPYTMEFTDGFIRFRSGTQLATTNDSQAIVAVDKSGTNALFATLNSSGWSSGNEVIFSGVSPIVQNRQFVITLHDSTHFTIADPISGQVVTSASIGAVNPGTVSRIQEISSPYAGGIWSTLRAVQAEMSSVILQGTIPPQILIATPPSGTNNATFSLTGVTFLDGPYLDPFTNGVQIVPGAVSGVVVLTLQFPTWLATKAYKKGDFVNYSGANYQSLADSNLANTPSTTPSVWLPVNPGAAINNGQGFLPTDNGRLLRMLSEPTIWNISSTYAQGNLVAYNPTGAPDASTYWTSLVNSNTGNVPGIDTTHWQLTPANAAIWSWAKIIGPANLISAATGVSIGTLIEGGGTNAAFDGNTSKAASFCAEFVYAVGITATDDYIGKNYTGSPQIINTAALFPSSDTGLVTCNSFGVAAPATVQVNLRANTHAPSGPSDGALLGTFPPFVTVLGSTPSTTGYPNPQNFGAVSIGSNDKGTAWNFVWFEIIVSNAPPPGYPPSNIIIAAAQAQFYSVPPSGNSSVFAEILGPPLVNTNPCITWRLGAYSATTGWPTNGTYHEGRIWLAGAIGNRFDASVSNGLVGATLNMAPTDQNGVVGAANALTEVINSDGVNQIFWMKPDLQGIIMGTPAGEWLISAPSTGPLSATNIFAHLATKIGCAFIEPRKSDHTIVFVQRYTKKVMEYFTDVYSGKFAAPNLAKDTMHITKPTVAELAYTNATTPIVWGRNNDGSWWGATYKRDTLATSTGPTINGWHRHTLGSGRSVQSIAAGPSVGGTLDALTMVTLDASTGIYHVEVMTDAVEEGDTLIQATYLDDAVNPTSVSSSTTTPAPDGGLTLNGLWHLNGKKVTAWLGGLDCGDYTVANGSITVPYGDGISAGTAQGLFAAGYAAMLSLSQMLVGFTFTSQGQIVRPATPAESGARNGPAVGKVRRNHKFAAQLEGTGTQVSFGYGFQPGQRNQAKFRQLNDVALLTNQQFTGVYKNTLTDNYSFDGMICWQVIRPYPLNIANIAGFIETSDE